MRKLSLAMMGIATAALMTMVSCRKPVNGLVTPGEARTVTFTATTESNDGSKTAVSDHDILWKTGDAISINGDMFTLDPNADGKTSGSFTGIISSGTPYYVGYPAATTKYTASPLTFSVGIPSSWTYDANNVVVPMAAYSTTEGNISFSNAVNVLKLNLNGNNTNASKLTSIVLSHAKANLNGDIAVTIDGEDPKFGYAGGTEATKTTTVSFGDGLQLTPETTSIYIVLPKINESSDKASDNDIKVTFNCANGGRIEKTIPYNPKFSDVNQLIHNDGNVLTVNATTLPGEFTVGSDSKGEPKKIKFSCGNLWYGEKGESQTKTWNLEDNQWDFKFTGEGENFYWDPDHVSHFFWSNTDDWKTPDYAPYAEKYDCYSPDIEDNFFTNASQTTPNDEFTVEGQTGWRTLSKDEWYYLLFSRKNASDLCGYLEDEDNGLYGLVLLPDGTDFSETPVSGITSAADLIAANAVFLPAAGYRDGIDDTHIFYIGQLLNYWSSTPAEDEINNAMRLYGGDKLVIDCEQRAFGRCIRLVK